MLEIARTASPRIREWLETGAGSEPPDEAQVEALRSVENEADPDRLLALAR